MRKKIKEHILGIIIALFLCLGVCTVVFGKNVIVQGGLTCLFWGVALFVFAYITKKRDEKDLNLFDIESREILADIGVNGVDSDYYGVYDISTLDKLRAKRVKKSRKQLFGVSSIAVVLMICAFVFIFG